MTFHETWSHHRVFDDHGAQSPHVRAPLPHQPHGMAKEKAHHTLPTTSSAHHELGMAQRSFDHPVTSSTSLPSQQVPIEMSPLLPLPYPSVDPQTPHPYTETPPYNPALLLGESINPDWNMPILCQNVYQNLIMAPAFYHPSNQVNPVDKPQNNAIMMQIGQSLRTLATTEKPVSSSRFSSSDAISYSPYAHSGTPVHDYSPSRSFDPSPRNSTPSYSPSAATSAIARRASTPPDHYKQSPMIKMETTTVTPSRNRANSIRKHSTTGISCGIKGVKGGSKGKTKSKSTRGASEPYCVKFEANFTLADGGKLMTGVAPSGSSKSKDRKTEQAVKAVERAGGDERVKAAVRAALR
ncbi:hypothetical protein VTO42DRAFT_6985 [Malbranchea cinnamomea]